MSVVIFKTVQIQLVFQLLEKLQHLHVELSFKVQLVQKHTSSNWLTEEKIGLKVEKLVRFAVSDLVFRMLKRNVGRSLISVCFPISPL